MKVFSSQSARGFFSSDVYAEADIPSDALELTLEQWQALRSGQDKGKIINFDTDGIPVLSEPAPQTSEQLISLAKIKRDNLMTQASAAIAPLQDASDLQIATDGELAALRQWKAYRVAVNRLDVSATPDIIWPEIPA